MPRASEHGVEGKRRINDVARWLSIGLRTLHLLGTAGVGAAFLYGAPEALWQPYLYLVVASGAALAALQVRSDSAWLMQVRGLAVFAKLVLLGTILVWPAAALPLFVAVIVISGVISHAPSTVRYYRPFRQRVVDTL